MAYSQKVVSEVLAYIDDGHTCGQAAFRFGVSKTSASLWGRKRGGLSRKTSSHPVRYPDDVVGKALALAYGGHGMRLDEVAVLLGVSAPTISNWKKKYMAGGDMGIPEIDPGEVERISEPRISEMTGAGLRGRIRKLELRTAAPESTGRILAVDATHAAKRPPLSV